jgi:hypothetical protein
MKDFRLIQDTTGKADYFNGDTIPDGCTLNPRPNVDRISGWWKAERDTQMAGDDSCVGESTGEIRVPVLCYSRIHYSRSTMEPRKKAGMERTGNVPRADERGVEWQRQPSTFGQS